MKISNLMLVALTLSLTSCQQDPAQVELVTNGTTTDLTKDETIVNAADVDAVINFQLKNWDRPNSRANDFTLSTIYNEDCTPSVYVVNFADDNGFILISATKTFYPILAYSESGNFSLDVTGMPDGLKDWISITKSYISDSKTLETDSVAVYKNLWNKITFKPTDYTATRSRSEGDITDNEFLELQEIVQNARMEYESAGHQTYAITEDVTNNAEFCQKMIDLAKESIYPLYDHVAEQLSFIVEYDEATTVTVPNMVETTWDQKQTYNRLFVKADGSGYYEAGCGPVALGQLFYFHKFPTTYAWNEMYTSFPSQATAELLYDIAKTAGCDLANENTHFSESKTESVFSKKEYTYSKINHNADKDVESLQNSKPVLMMGLTTSDTGHMWLATGVNHYEGKHYYKYITLTNSRRLGEFGRSSENYFNKYFFYMNWGCGGSYNGYYDDYDLAQPDNGKTYYNRVDYINVTPIK